MGERPEDIDKVNHMPASENYPWSQKAQKQPMSGWRRLWIVLSVLFGLLTALAAHDEYNDVYTWYTPSSALDKLAGKDFYRALFAEASKQNAELKNCDLKTVDISRSGSDYIIKCKTHTAFAVTFALLWALLPAAFMYVTGKTARWVYRGFRPPNNSRSDG